MAESRLTANPTPTSVISSANSILSAHDSAGVAGAGFFQGCQSFRMLPFGDWSAVRQHLSVRTSLCSALLACGLHFHCLAALLDQAQTFAESPVSNRKKSL
jgi:hypothetical protein